MLVKHYIKNKKPKGGKKMLMITPIKNVQNTINKNISFKSGVRTNYGAESISLTGDSKNQGGFLADFLGSIKQSPLFYETFFERQASIEKGLNIESNSFDAIA